MITQINSFFGTDGIRGIANQGNITAEVAMKIGAAAGTIFINGSHRHLVVIGKDTRLSGYLLEPALTSGFIAMGMDVLLVGPMPTPAISMLVKSLRADLGIMISASHNPHQYNGIKIFGPTGTKLDRKTENKISDLIFNYPKNIKFASAENLGRASRLDDAPGRYIEFAKSTFPNNKTLSGLKIVIDSANGAAYHLSKKIFWELGAEVIHIGNQPDGFNINKNCGSTDCKAAQKTVIVHKADIGIVLDGDADRVIIIDEKANIIDGDKILATIGLHMQKRGELHNNKIVATHMSNIALENFLASKGISLIRTDVGDKNVAQELEKNAYSLGGEQSGHIIIPRFSATGDGIIAGLKILDALTDTKHGSIAKLCDLYTPVSQILLNVDYCHTKESLDAHPNLENHIQKSNKKLGKDGRILVRRSGTEPVIRIMIESNDKELAETIAREIQDIINSI